MHDARWKNRRAAWPVKSTVTIDHLGNEQGGSSPKKRHNRSKKLKTGFKKTYPSLTGEGDLGERGSGVGEVQIKTITWDFCKKDRKAEGRSGQTKGQPARSLGSSTQTYRAASLNQRPPKGSANKRSEPQSIEAPNTSGALGMGRRESNPQKRNKVHGLQKPKMLAQRMVKEKGSNKIPMKKGKNVFS